MEAHNFYPAPAPNASLTAITAWLAFLNRLSIQAAALPTPDEADALCRSGAAESLVTLVYSSAERTLREQHICRFWAQLSACRGQAVAAAVAHNAAGDDGDGGSSTPGAAYSAAELEAGLSSALLELCAAFEAQQQQLSALCRQVLLVAAEPPPPDHSSRQPQQSQPTLQPHLISAVANLPARLQRAAAALLMATAPFSLTDLLQAYYAHKLEELSAAAGPAADTVGADCHPDGDTELAVDSDEEMMADQENEDGGGGSYSLHAATAASPAAVRRGAATSSGSERLGPAWCRGLQTVSQCLRRVGLEAASEEAYTTVINGHVAAQLRVLVAGDFDAGALQGAQRYVSTVPYEFLQIVLAPREPQQAQALLQEWQLRLTYYVYETLGALRIGQMFDIVVDYPDSGPAVADARECLRHANLHAAFVSRFRGAVRMRLLHAGAATADIITHYVRTIKTLRDIDASGSLLEAVSGPVRHYLCGRSDTIRCIVNMLTEDSEETGEGGASLLEEVDAAQQQEQQDAAGGTGQGDGDDAALRAAQALVAGAAAPCANGTGRPPGPLPDPLSASVPLGPVAPRDIVSLLIGIYGSRELFIDEYRVLLAGRLLGKLDFDCDREIRTLELLKLRFGEGNLHNCEVMLKDLADSKRLQHTVTQLAVAERHQQQRAGAATSSTAAQEKLGATVVSHLFWPALQEADMLLPADVVQAQEAYAGRFHSLKAPRKLLWRPTLGVVELQVRIGPAALDFKVTPVHAAMLLQFRDAVRRSAVELAAALRVPPAVLRRKALFWVNNGVLLESRGAGGDVLYTRATHLDPNRAITAECTDMLGWEDDGPAVVLSPEEALQAEMAPFEAAIVNMLTSMGQASLERLHAVLRIFMREPKFDKSTEQLAAFLGVLVERGKIGAEGHVYTKRRA